MWCGRWSSPAASGLQVAVRGGAHSIAGFSTSDGGIVIDTSPMKGIRVDPAGRRAVAQPGLTWSELDHETQAFGLAVTGGLVSSTGITGFTLGGGIGGPVAFSVPWQASGQDEAEVTWPARAR
jgi:FAD/FMN-containing dehydrogenase